MKEDKEISSTEKLLNLIRGGAGKSGDSPGAQPLLKPRKKNIINLSSFIKAKHTPTIGVEVGFKNIRLVKMLSYESHCELLDYKTSYFDPEIPMESSRFFKYLQKELKEFAGPSKKINIWVSLPIDKGEVTHVLIPKVPKRQISGVAYYTAKKEHPFDESESIFDYEAQEEVMDNKKPRISVMTYTANKSEVEKLKSLFSKSGFPLTGITIAPLTIQNLFRSGCLEESDQIVACLTIGHELSLIDIISKGNLSLTRYIRTGTDSMIEDIMDVVGKGNIDNKKAKDLLFSLQQDSQSFPPYEKEDIFKMIQPAVDRLVSQTERTLEHFTVSLGRGMVGMIYVNSSLAVYKPLVDYIGERLGLKSSVIDPMSPGKCVMESVEPPKKLEERLIFARTVGCALSDNSRTPNLLFIYKAKEQIKTIANIYKGVFLSIMLLVSLCFFASTWFGHIVSKKEASLAELKPELRRFTPKVESNHILKLGNEEKKRNKANKSLSARYLGLGLISEITAMTKDNVFLTNIEAFFGDAPDSRKKKKKGKDDKDKELILEGIVQGDRDLFDSVLAGYLVRLESSPLLEEPEVLEKKVTVQKQYGSKEVLHFVFKFKLVT